MPATRRTFLTVAGSTTVVALGGPLPSLLRKVAAGEAASRGETVLVVVQLTGGNDGLNTVIPYGDDAYHRNRFALDYRAEAVLKIDDYLGLHPAMRGFADLLEAGKLAIVQGVGYPHPNRSHFESMDIWHTARLLHDQREPAARPTGWLGRGLDAVRRSGGDLPAMHLGGEAQPLALRGLDAAVPSLRTLDTFKLNTGGDRRLQQSILAAAAAPRGGENELLGFLQANTAAALEAARRIEMAAQGGRTAAAYPATGLGEKLRSVAQLILAGLDTRIYYLTLDGFDTHANQRDAHAALLAELSGAAHAFLEDLARHGHGERVLLMTQSEFGRRVRENASGGTDHGAAAPMLLAGERVRGGLVGKHPSLSDLEDGDLKFHTDFRSVYAGILKHWLDWDPAPLVGADFAPLEVAAS